MPQQPVRRGDAATARHGPPGLITIDRTASEQQLRLYARGSADRLWQTELQAAPGDNFYGEGLLSLVPKAPTPSSG